MDRGYLPLVVIEAQLGGGDAHIGRLLGWLHPTEEPIWSFPPEKNLHLPEVYVGDHRDDGGDLRGVIACADPEQEQQWDPHLRWVVTAKGRWIEARMVASTFSCEALIWALGHPCDLTLEDVHGFEDRPLKAWKVKFRTPVPSVELYICFHWDIPQDGALAGFLEMILIQRDQAHIELYKDLVGKAGSMMRGAQSRTIAEE